MNLALGSLSSLFSGKSKNFKKIVLIQFVYLSLLLDIQLNGFVNAMTNQEVEQHLEMGKKLLAAGQLADALTQYHLAIDGDPNNYMSYYRRGTVYLAMGKFKSALSDLNRVVELKPDFTAARMQRANILVKQGMFKEAIEDYEAIIKVDQSNSEATSRLDKIFSLLNDLGTAKRHMSNRDYLPAIDLLTNILESCPWSTEIHEYRSDCYLNIGESGKAVLDINALAKLIPDNTQAYLKLTEIHYASGDAEQALNNVRECLRLDADHKKCSDHYKTLRKLTKAMDKMRKAHDEQRYAECVTQANLVINNDPNSLAFRLKGLAHICMCQSKAKNVKEAVQACSDVLKAQPNDIEALFHRAQAYIVDEQLESAQHDCQKAHEIENSQRTHECIDKVNRLIKQSKKRDYYKILGVKRSADQKTIMRAYRKLAQQYHPDRYPDGAEKEKAQKTFIDIAAAKEVLSDAEKRAKFDSGEDPLDPDQSHQHNPFQGGGFNPFGGGGFNGFNGGNGGGFKFNFKFN